MTTPFPPIAVNLQNSYAQMMNSGVVSVQPNPLSYSIIEEQPSEETVFDKYDVAELSPSREFQHRSVPQPVFKQKYFNLQDARLRLLKSLIFVGNEVFVVLEVGRAGKDYILLLGDHQQHCHTIKLGGCEYVDLRTPEPQYLNVHGRVVYLCRRPKRQQAQGLQSGNCFFKDVGKDCKDFNSDTNRNILNIKVLLKAFNSQKDISWGPEKLGLLKERVVTGLRLSKYLSTFINDKDEIFAEYRGRTLGEIKHDRIDVASPESNFHWIAREAENAGLKF